MSMLFISYCNSDQEHLDEVVAKLKLAFPKQNTVFDHVDSNTGFGDDFCKEIKQKIRRCDFVLLIVSKESLESQWVMYELIEAAKHEKPVIPYLVDANIDPASQFPPYLKALAPAKDLDTLIKDIRRRREESIWDPWGQFPTGLRLLTLIYLGLILAGAAGGKKLVDLNECLSYISAPTATELNVLLSSLSLVIAWIPTLVWIPILPWTPILAWTPIPTLPDNPVCGVSVITFALMLFVSDVVHEVYGERAAKSLIIPGILGSILFTGLILTFRLLPEAIIGQGWSNELEAAFDDTHAHVIQVMIWGTFAYATTQLLDVKIFQALLNYFGYRYGGIRSLVSKTGSQLFNTLLYIFFVYRQDSVSDLFFGHLIAKIMIAVLGAMIFRRLTRSFINLEKSGTNLCGPE